MADIAQAAQACIDNYNARTKQKVYKRGSVSRVCHDVGRSMEREGNSLEVDSQSLSVCPDVSQSMEREGDSVEMDSQSLLVCPDVIRSMGNSVEVDGQSLSVCPDVSLSMEREGNSVEVDGQSLSVCPDVSQSMERLAVSSRDSYLVVRYLPYTVSNALARRILHNTCLIHCHYLLSVSVIVCIDIESLGLGKVFARLRTRPRPRHCGTATVVSFLGKLRHLREFVHGQEIRKVSIFFSTLLPFTSAHT